LRHAILVLGSLLAASPLARAARAQGAPLHAVRTAHAPVIDGRLAEPEWQTAMPDDHFAQTFPHSGRTPSQRTEIAANLARRDADVETDWVAVGIDSRHDHASFIFLVTAAGEQRDAAGYDDVQLCWDWDAVWASAVSIDAGGASPTTPFATSPW
jgi:hypothetical protein